MGQRVRKSHRGQCPSSARQLPILAALHARSPTLFSLIIQENAENVNSYFSFFATFFPFGSQHRLFVTFDEKSSKNGFCALAFCAILLYNGHNYCKEGSLWAN